MSSAHPVRWEAPREVVDVPATVATPVASLSGSAAEISGSGTSLSRHSMRVVLRLGSDVRVEQNEAA